MLQKYLFFEILNSEDPKKYEEFKNLVNYDFLIYFTKKRENYWKNVFETKKFGMNKN